MKNSCLIVGAGMAGLTAAAELQRQDWDVQLLDKGRGVGGRMATRRIGDSRFDHGAQFFTVRDDRFRRAVDRWESEGVVSPWFNDGGNVRYRATRGMNALAKRLAQGLEIRTGTKVASVQPSGGEWVVVTETGETMRAGALLLTAPAPQSAALLEAAPGTTAHGPSGLIDSLRQIAYEPCFALLAILDGPSRVPAPGFVRLHEGPIECIADNTQKGIAAGPVAITLHARADFSVQHLDAPESLVARLLLEAAEPWIGARVASWQLHRWRYSRAVPAERPACLFSREPVPLAIAGDAFGSSRIETAFLSGLAAAEQIAATMV